MQELPSLKVRSTQTTNKTVDMERQMWYITLRSNVPCLSIMD